MDTVLITGASGLLGEPLANFLRGIGYRVITHSRGLTTDYSCDLVDINAMHTLIFKVRPDVIINAAALTNVDACQANIELAYLQNSQIVKNIVDCLVDLDLDAYLMQISTDHIYGGIGPHKESNVSILNNYALTKYCGELEARKIKSAILRVNFIGKSLRSERISLSDWAYLRLSKNEYIEAFEDVYFSPLLIGQLVETLSFLISVKPNGLFNIGSRGGISKADFISAFAEELGFTEAKIRRIKISDSANINILRPKDMRMDSAKIEKELSIKLPSIEDVIREIAREYYVNT